MKRLLFVFFALISISALSQRLPLDTRDINKCGFSSKSAAEAASVQERVQNSIINPDEMACDGSVYQNSSGSWCYSITYTCIPPRPSPTPTLIKKFAKVRIENCENMTAAQANTKMNSDMQNLPATAFNIETEIPHEVTTQLPDGTFETRYCYSISYRTP